MVPCHANPKGAPRLQDHTASLFRAVALLELVIVPIPISVRPLSAGASQTLTGV